MQFIEAEEHLQVVLPGAGFGLPGGGEVTDEVDAGLNFVLIRLACEEQSPGGLDAFGFIECSESLVEFSGALSDPWGVKEKQLLQRGSCGFSARTMRTCFREIMHSEDGV